MPKKTKNKREIIYPDPDAVLYRQEEDNPVTEVMVERMLGWTEPDKDQTFDEYLFKDGLGNTIKCLNVDLQRPFYKKDCEKIMWIILSGQFRLNFQPALIGETGLVLDGKHRFIALKLACQEYRRNPERYPFFSQEPTIDMLVAYGAEESKELVNTIDTGRPRSIADSLYASGIFEGESAKTMRILCRMTQYAFNLLWRRTGAYLNAYHPKPSHADCLEFLDTHPSVLQCVRTVHYENNDRRIERVLSGGYASALLYLMSLSGTNPDKYTESDNPTEMMCDNSRMEQAEEFWLKVAHDDKSVSPIVNEIAKLSEGGNVNAYDRVAIIIKGWNAWYERGKVTPKDIKIKTMVDDYGIRHLLEDPVMTGIDVGMDEPEPK